MSPITLRAATADDGPELATIYNHYIRETIITFEESAIDGAAMAARVAEVQSAGLPWLVAEHEGQVLGNTYASKWKGRCAYRHSVETTIYLEPANQRRGIGSQLYHELLGVLADRGYHAALGGISLPNEGSVALHERFGFQKVAHFTEVGFKFGKWIDVGYWQRML